jgi:hypothetical protein
LGGLIGRSGQRRHRGDRSCTVSVAFCLKVTHLDVYSSYRDVKQLKSLLAHVYQLETGKLKPGQPVTLPIRHEKKFVLGAALMRASIDLPRAANVHSAREAVSRLALAVAQSVHHGPAVAFALADFLLCEAGCTLPIEDIDTAREAFTNALQSARVTDVARALRYWKH